MGKSTTGRRAQFAFTSAFVLFVAWEYIERGPVDAAQLTILEREASRIQPEVGASRDEPQVLSKPDLASFRQRYHSRSSCLSVFSYYDAELARNGWRFVREYRAGHWAYRRYAKQDDTADVDCGGRLDDSYVVSFGWNGPTSGYMGLTIFVSLFLAIFGLSIPAESVGKKLLEAKKGTA